VSPENLTKKYYKYIHSAVCPVFIDVHFLKISTIPSISTHFNVFTIIVAYICRLFSWAKLAHYVITDKLKLVHPVLDIQSSTGAFPILDGTYYKAKDTDAKNKRPRTGARSIQSN